MKEVTIFLTEMRLNCIIGCNKEERSIPQDILVDVSYTVNAVVNDELINTVNYDEVVVLIERHLKDGKYQLLERGVASVAGMLLHNFGKIIAVTVRITKPSALKCCREVSCEISLKR